MTEGTEEEMGEVKDVRDVEEGWVGTAVSRGCASRKLRGVLSVADLETRRTLPEWRSQRASKHPDELEEDTVVDDVPRTCPTWASRTCLAPSNPKKRLCASVFRAVVGG